MLWELRQVEAALDELAAQRQACSRSTALSVKARERLLVEIAAKESALNAARREYLQKIHSDPLLSRMRDQQVMEDEGRRREKEAGLPEAERGLAETAGQPPKAAEAQRSKLDAYMKNWSQRSVDERQAVQHRELEKDRERER